MADITFYHLTHTPLERALPKLLEKAYAGGHRCVVLASAGDLESLQRLLWQYDPDSFLPHGSKGEPHPEKQPIYLTDSEEDNPNQATLLFVTDGKEHRISTVYQRVLDLFDGGSPEAVANARQRWKSYESQGYKLQYRQQDAQGGWK